MAPWNNDEDSSKHNKHATGKAGALWRGIANSVLAKTGDEGRAIREANHVLGQSRHAPKKRFGKKRT